MARVLLVDDEADIVWALRYSLEDEGYEVLTAQSGTEALSIAQLQQPDLVILDIIMPQMDGLEVCRRLRRDPGLASVPILFLTQRAEIEDRVAGLDEGGDDYLVKPFDIRELKAHVRALLRRSRPAGEGAPRLDQGSILVVGPLALDLQAARVRVKGEWVQLTPTERSLLRHFLLHPGQVFSSASLLSEVWDYAPDTAGPGLVRWHIRNLRTKIEDDPSNPCYIRTVPRHGFILPRDI